MKLTLLEIVKDILNDMDSDEVNSINDTVESQQVAQIIKTSYFEMIGNRNWPHLKKLIQLEASGDLNKPNYLKLPEGTKELVLVKYNTKTLTQPRTRLVELTYKEPDSFLRLVSSRNSASTKVKEVVDFSGTSLLILNNTPPTYWTSFDDNYLITDSYDAVVDSTLQKVKTQALAYMEPLWSQTDDFIPDLPSEAFSALGEEAKSTAFLVLKQMANQKSEQRAGRQQRWLARKAWAAKGGVVYQNYGRASRK